MDRRESLKALFLGSVSTGVTLSACETGTKDAVKAPKTGKFYGRTPDEGAVSEAAMAWTLGKPMVAYKDDVRSLIAGRVNPPLVGLVSQNSDYVTAFVVPALCYATLLFFAIASGRARLPQREAARAAVEPAPVEP